MLAGRHVTSSLELPRHSDASEQHVLDVMIRQNSYNLFEPRSRQSDRSEAWPGHVGDAGAKSARRSHDAASESPTVATSRRPALNRSDRLAGRTVGSIGACSLKLGACSLGTGACSLGPGVCSLKLGASSLGLTNNQLHDASPRLPVHARSTEKTTSTSAVQKRNDCVGGQGLTKPVPLVHEAGSSAAQVQDGHSGSHSTADPAKPAVLPDEETPDSADGKLQLIGQYLGDCERQWRREYGRRMPAVTRALRQQQQQSARPKQPVSISVALCMDISMLDHIHFISTRIHCL